MFWYLGGLVMYEEICRNCHNYEVERGIWIEKAGRLKEFQAPCYLTGELKKLQDSCEKIEKFPITDKNSK